MRGLLHSQFLTASDIVTSYSVEFSELGHRGVVASCDL